MIKLERISGNPFNPAAVTVKDRNGKPISHHEAFNLGADAQRETIITKLEQHYGLAYNYQDWRRRIGGLIRELKALESKLLGGRK